MTTDTEHSVTKEVDAHRLRVALGVIARTLYGEGLESLKPISAQFAHEVTDFAEAARWGEPCERLDEAVRNNPDA